MQRKTAQDIRDHTNKLLGIAASMQLSSSITQAQILKHKQFLHISQQNREIFAQKYGKVKYPTIEVQFFVSFLFPFCV